MRAKNAAGMRNTNGNANIRPPGGHVEAPISASAAARPSITYPNLRAIRAIPSPQSESNAQVQRRAAQRTVRWNRLSCRRFKRVPSGRGA